MRRAVRRILRLVAGTLVLFGFLQIGIELTRHWMHHTPIRLWHPIIGTILMLVGVFLFLASASLADQLTDDVDDDEGGEGEEQNTEP